MDRVTFTIGNSYTTIDGDRHAAHLLDQALSVESPGAFWARKHRPGWDGKWHPVDVVRRNFPTGLLSRAKDIIPLAKVVDERVRPGVIPFHSKILRDITLVDHQEKAVKKSLTEGRGIVGLGVGAGKTEVGIAVACHVQGSCVWLTHRKDLFHQTAERIRVRTGEEPALMGDGSWTDTEDRKFIIAMPQTVKKDLRMFIRQVENSSVVVMDEVHRVAASSDWYKIAQLIPAYYKIGLSGSFETGDPVRDLRFVAATGDLLVRMKASELAAIGWSVPVNVIYHKMNNDAVPANSDYRTARKILIEENPERNAEIVILAMKEAAAGKRCLIICDTVKHAVVISGVLKAEDVRSRMLTGKNTSKARVEAKKDMKSGALEILVSSTIWDEGIDLPELDTVILAAGGKSAVRMIQRCGRALRKAKGKTEATVHDFFDFGSRYTVRHSIARMNAARKEGFNVVAPAGI